MTLLGNVTKLKSKLAFIYQTPYSLEEDMRIVSRSLPYTCFAFLMHSADFHSIRTALNQFNQFKTSYFCNLISRDTLQVVAMPEN